MARDLLVYSDEDRESAARVTGAGESYAKACRAVVGADARQVEINAIRQRIQPLVREIHAAAVESAAISRADLIEQARQDRDFAIDTGNAAAAISATKLLAQLVGAVDESSAVDPIRLLEAVERIAAARHGPVNVTPGTGKPPRL